MFSIFRKRKKECNYQETLSIDSKEGMNSLYASLYSQVQENLVDRCCLHIFRDGKEHYHVANVLNTDEIAKELYIEMNRSGIIRDAVIGAYRLCFASEKEKDDIKGDSYTMHSLNGPFDGMVCNKSTDNNYIFYGKKKYHVDVVKSLDDFYFKFRDMPRPYRSMFTAVLADEHNVLALVEGDVNDVIDSLVIASANNEVIDHIICKSK